MVKLTFRFYSVSTLYDTKNLSLSYFELLKLAHSTEINITEEQIALVQSSTVEQNHSKIWFRNVMLQANGRLGEVV